MPTIFRRNSVIVLALAILFYWAFMFAKHDAALREVIPFGVDPYEAANAVCRCPSSASVDGQHRGTDRTSDMLLSTAQSNERGRNRR